ncbi:c-type cytochrome [Halomonas alkalisoli]|uniref:c-type cytochrome n=1 Tax=Halomonas alkalisoli TaxID=2907158 RepID=UPI001F1C6DC2|nr:c-type cytochrome [Halomonas alkalisoli]MCE9680818.1 hypothetical protein [Halomonas alkalisoli]
MKTNSLMTGALAVFLLASASQSVFASAHERNLIRQHDCTKCHAISRPKEGPSLAEIAEKYRDDPDAVGTLYNHVTTETMVEVDGKEEAHKPIAIDDRAEVENLIRWILSH